MKIVRTGLISLLAVAGLSIAASACAESMVGHTGTVANGIRLNGPVVQGLKINGVKFQGVRLNGLRGNGISLQGTKRNGVGLPGASMRGYVGSYADSASNGQVRGVVRVRMPVR